MVGRVALSTRSDGSASWPSKNHISVLQFGGGRAANIMQPKSGSELIILSS